MSRRNGTASQKIAEVSQAIEQLNTDDHKNEELQRAIRWLGLLDDRVQKLIKLSSTRLKAIENAVSEHKPDSHTEGVIEQAQKKLAWIDQLGRQLAEESTSHAAVLERIRKQMNEVGHRADVILARTEATLRRVDGELRVGRVNRADLESIQAGVMEIGKLLADARGPEGEAWLSWFKSAALRGVVKQSSGAE